MVEHQLVAASSVASFRGIPSLTAYGASKSALNTAIKTLSIELASKKIRVNGIAPGYVDTEMNSSIKEKLPKGAYERILNEHPLGIGEPRDISNLVVFLLSDESKWISGTTIPNRWGIFSKIDFMQLIIVGAGSFGREVYTWLLDTIDKKKDYEIKGFIDNHSDNQKILRQKKYPIKLIGNINDYRPKPNERLIVSIADQILEKKL